MELVLYCTTFVLLFLAVMSNMAKLVCCWHQTSRVRVVSLTESLVWGPGLDVDVVIPVRYFFIQPADTGGHNFTESLGDNFTVQVNEAANGVRTRTMIQVLDRHDGSYLVRYKFWQGYHSVVISVLYNGQHVAASPYTLSGGVYNELCNCPQPSLSKWLSTMQCPASYEQITRDLSQFGKIDMSKVAKEAMDRFSSRGAHSLCHYVIKDNRVYRRTQGEHVGFKMFSDDFLLSLTRKVRLPDVEFVINLGDWPLEHKQVTDNPLPILSWCGSDDTRDIVMPTYDVTESTLETLGRVSLDMMSVQANTGPSWENKSSLAFWRGRDSRQERLDLVRLSRRHPDIIDARLTRMFFFKHTPDLGDTVEPISFFDFFKYKYQVSVDGTVAAYRLPYLLAGDSVVLKQNSPYYEFFYKQLRPYEHYIPVKADLSDLLDRIQWAKDHDSEAQQIAKNAQNFVRNNLMPKDIYCYYGKLFEEYSKKLVKPPKVLHDMELVEHKVDNSVPCTCERASTSTRDEL